MAIGLGGTAINKIAFGGTELLKAYHGVVMIHDKTGAPPVADVILLENGTDALLLETGNPVEIDATIPAQTTATALDGTEWTVIVQGGTAKKARLSLLASYIND
jgi:hypothetical protein